MKGPRAVLTEHRLGAAVVGFVVALAAGIGIGAAVWGSSGGTATVSASSTAPSTSTPSSPHRHRGVRGTITAESGSTWSLTTPAGEVVSVTLTAQTRFGTSAAPATQGRFVVGSPVTVIGQLDGSAITAKRVYTPLRPLGGGGTTTTLPPGAATGAAAAFNGGDLNGGVLDGGVGPAGDTVPAAWAAFSGSSQGVPRPVLDPFRTVDLGGGEHGHSGPLPVRT